MMHDTNVGGAGPLFRLYLALGGDRISLASVLGPFLTANRASMTPPPGGTVDSKIYEKRDKTPTAPYLVSR